MRGGGGTFPDSCLNKTMISSDFHAEMFVELSGPLDLCRCVSGGPGIVWDMQGSNHVVRVSKYFELSSSENGSGKCISAHGFTSLDVETCASP